MKLATAILLGTAVFSPGLALSATPDTTTPPKGTARGAPVKVTSVEGITEYRLANGLRVMLFPDPSKPTLTTNIVYMVGSRHENYGETGMAHLLEHLLFKPSANFGVKKGTRTPVEILNAIGGEFNGTTWFDRTNYYATFPANDDNLRLMLALEADRMVNAAIDQNDLWNTKTNKGEMTVVRNEFEMGESDPIGVTTERIQAIAYDWHNYGKSAIGARSDIEQVNIQRLRAFYKTYYQPDNAILMVAGRFDSAKVLQQVDALFGRIPRPTRVMAPTYTAEPTQDGERAVTVRRSGGTQFIGAGYHVAPSGHEDAAALSLLARILVDAPSGRLYKALIETKLATRLQYEPVSNLEPGYRIFGALVAKEDNLDLTQAAMLKVLEDFKTQPVTAEEVARAKQQLNKDIELTVNDTARLSIALTESLAAGDWRLFYLQRDRTEKLDAAAVQAAALKYLMPSNRTLGRFIPTDTPLRAEIPGTPNVQAMVKDYAGRAVVAQGEAFDASPANIEARTQRFSLPGGLKAALLPKKTKGATVSVALRLRLGTEESLRGRAQAGVFAASLLSSGTEKMSREQIKDAFDAQKAEVSFSGGAEGVTATITTTRDHLPASLDLLAELLKKSTFPAKEFREQQLEAINRIEQEIPEPQPQAVSAFRRLIDATPENHVRHVLALPAQLAATKAVTVDEVKAFHAAYYGAEHATFAAVGDFDPVAVKAQLGKLFGDWKATQPYVRIPQTHKPTAGAKIMLETPDKANSMLFAIHPLPIKDSAESYPALVLANHMLGGGALRSRLADRIRQKEGLSYGVGSQLNASALDPTGLWLAYAISAPQNTPKVEAALREELQKVLADGFTADELAEAKKGWKQAAEVERTQDASLANRLNEYLVIERTLAFDKDLEAKVAALTLPQVNQALRQHLKPENISVVSAGDFAKVGAAAAVKP